MDNHKEIWFRERLESSLAQPFWCHIWQPLIMEGG